LKNLIIDENYDVQAGGATGAGQGRKKKRFSRKKENHHQLKGTFKKNLNQRMKNPRNIKPKSNSLKGIA